MTHVGLRDLVAMRKVLLQHFGELPGGPRVGEDEAGFEVQASSITMRFCPCPSDPLRGKSASLKTTFNISTRRIDSFRADADVDSTLNRPERDSLPRASAV
jgi:hypothetical protein